MQPALQFRGPPESGSGPLQYPEKPLKQPFIGFSYRRTNYVRWLIWNGRVAKWGKVG